MGEHKELVASFEHMGNGVWFVDTAWALGDEATEIVRCRDCVDYNVKWCKLFGGMRDEFDFCSKGERRNDV